MSYASPRYKLWTFHLVIIPCSGISLPGNLFSKDWITPLEQYFSSFCSPWGEFSCIIKSFIGAIIRALIPTRELETQEHPNRRCWVFTKFTFSFNRKQRIMILILFITTSSRYNLLLSFVQVLYLLITVFKVKDVSTSKVSFCFLLMIRSWDNSLAVVSHFTCPNSLPC